MSDYLSEYRSTPRPSGYAGRKRRQRDPESGKRPPSLPRAVARENLFAAAATLKSQGHAAGPDRVSPREVTAREAGEIARGLSSIALAGGYVPSRTRTVEFRKPGGGTRQIRIASVASRVLSTALLESLTTYCNSRGTDASYGWRRGLDGRLIFVRLAAAVAQGKTWLLHDDIRRCFDELPTRVAVELLREHFGETPGLAELLESVVSGHPCERRALGIPQGDALSPLVANLVLDARLDRPVLEAQQPATYSRFADNLIWLGPSENDVLAAREQAVELLGRIGLSLKGEEAAVDLAAGGKPPLLLGFRVSARDGVLRLSIPGKAWASLEAKLAASHEAPDADRTAAGVFWGWVRQYGAAIPEDLDGFLRRVGEAGRKSGVREYDFDALAALAMGQRDRWQESFSEAATP